MTGQITLETALRLVTFIKDSDGRWRVGIVHGNVHGDVGGDIRGKIHGDVYRDVEGSIRGDVRGNVGGSVRGTISGKKWTSIETPREKLARLINESGNAELIETLNELEDLV